MCSKKKAIIRSADDGLGRFLFTLGLSSSAVYRTDIEVMPVTVTTTVTVKRLRRSPDVMFERYSGAQGYIMSNEFRFRIHNF